MATVITTLAQLQSACSSGGTYELGANISDVAVTVAYGKTLTLDLKTYNLIGTGSATVIQAVGNLVLNGTTGKITGGGGTYGGGIFVGEHSNATINGGIITGNSANYGGGVYIEWKGNLYVNGGSIVGNTANVNYGGVYFGEASIYLSGTSVIKDNVGGDVCGVDGQFSNIIISGNLSDGAKIRISYPEPVLGGSVAYNNLKYSGVEHIFSDDGALVASMPSSGNYAVWVPYVPPTPTAITLPVNVNGVWKDAVPKVNVNGVWKKVIGIWANVSGTWKVVAPFVPPEPDHRVYTISWLENSTSKNITWADDAASMTEADRLAKIKEHCHFAVVHWGGSKPAVNYWLYDEDLNYRATDKTGKVSSGTTSDLTGTDGDVMMLYETVFWKVTTSGSGTSRRITISFTWDEANTDSTWVSPHHYGDTLDSTTYAKYVGMGVFEALKVDSQMRSVYSSSNPTGSGTQNNFYNAAIYGRNWQYNNMLPMTYAWYIICLYFVKGDRDCQNAYGNGIVGASGVQPLNTSWSTTNPWINGTTADQTHGVTALGIHNPWGNTQFVMGEMLYNNKVFKYSVLGGKDHYNIESGSASTWKSATVSNNISNLNITAINGANEYPFFPEAGSGSDYSQNYTDSADTSRNSSCYVLINGIYDYGLKSGPLCMGLRDLYYFSLPNITARLHVLITED